MDDLDAETSDAFDAVTSATDLDHHELAALVESVQERTAVGPVPSEMSVPLPKVPSWVSLTSLAKLLDMKLNTVIVWNKRGKLPRPDEMVNGRPLWTRKTIKVWLSQLAALASE